MSDFGTVWETASVGRKNRLLKSMLQAIYVDLDAREVIGILPKKAFMALIMAMADRTDVEVLDASRECFSRNGGDGGGSNSPSRRSPDRICYRLVRRFVSRLGELTPAQSPLGQPICL